MALKRGNNSFMRACDIIEKEIKQALRSAEKRLPSISAMAHAGRISKDALRRALAVYKKAGNITVRPYRGITVTGNKPVFQVPATGSGAWVQETGNDTLSKRMKWKEIAATIEKEIVEGRINLQDVPMTIKEFMVRYDSSYYIARKAVDDLVRRNVLFHGHRGFRSITLSPEQGYTTIVLVVMEFSTGIETFPGSTLATNFFHGAERACLQSGIRLTLTRFSYSVDTRQNIHRYRLLLDNGNVQSSVAGYLFWTRGFNCEQSLEILEWLVSYKKPVSILDEFFFDDVVGHVFRNSRISYFPVSIPAVPAREAVRHLIDLGHRSIGYVRGMDSLPDEPGRLWRKKRLEGVRLACRQAGIENSLSVFSLNVTEDWAGYELFDDTIIGFVRENIHNLLTWKAIPKPVPQKIVDAMYVVNYHLLAMESIGQMIAGELQDFLSRVPVTALLCANDMIALACMKAVVSWGASVPRDISIMGFDDIPMALQERLTTYNFNMDSIARAMIDSVLTCHRRRHKSGINRVVVDGCVVRRESTGLAPVKLYRPDLPPT